MALFAAKAVLNGEEVDVELDDDTFIPQAQHRTILERTIKDRLDRQRRSVSAELEKDEEFITKLLTARGIDPTAKPGEVPADLVERFQRELRERELGPVQQENEKLKGNLDKTRQRILERQLELDLIAANVKPTMAKRIARMEALNFGFDEEMDDFAVREGDGFAWAPSASKERPYKGTADFAKEWAANPDNADFVVEPQTQAGPGVGKEVRRQTQAKVSSKADLKTAAEKARYIGEHGHEAYLDLPDTA